VQNTDGVLLEAGSLPRNAGEGIEVFAGYGRDHDRNIGAASFSVRIAKGKIVFHTLPGLIEGMSGKHSGMHPLIAKRLMANSLRFLGAGR
jgi:hypothetical protein